MSIHDKWQSEKASDWVVTPSTVNLQPVKKADTTAKPMTFNDVIKFNPYHDERGRFSTADAATLFTIRTKDPDKQYLADAGIRREKERDAAERAAAGNDETPRMKAIHDIEDRIRNQDFESAACIDNDGNVLFFKDGEEAQVVFTRQESAMMQGNTLTHNHPSSSIFSREDVDCWVDNNIQEIRATNRLGITYSLQQGENYNKADGESFTLSFRINQGQALRKAQKTLDDRGYQWKIASGEVTVEQANVEFRKILNKEMTSWCEKAAPKHGIIFSVEKREIPKAASYTEYTAKATDESDIAFTLDKETEAEIESAFSEWLSRAKENAREGTKININEKPTQTEKSAATESGNNTEWTIVKSGDDKRLVFGWASISITADGEQLEDLQHDIISPEDLEEAVYEYVLNFRDTGEEHRPNLRKKGKLVESCVFTPEKQRAMGLPEGILPVGWWIGFKIEDDEAWEKVKNGTYKMFSIEGRANRVPVEKAAPEEVEHERFDFIQDFDFP